VSSIGNRQSSIGNRRVPFPAFPASDSGLILFLNFESAICNFLAPALLGCREYLSAKDRNAKLGAQT
jgi:hypothetical protein